MLKQLLKESATGGIQRNSLILPCCLPFGKSPASHFEQKRFGLSLGDSFNTDGNLIFVVLNMTETRLHVKPEVLSTAAV